MFNPWIRKILWRRAWQPTPVFLPGKFHGQRSLAVYSRWDHKDSDMIEHDDSTRKEQSKTLGCELDQSVVRPVNFIWGLLCSKL